MIFSEKLLRIMPRGRSTRAPGNLPWNRTLASRGFP